jgi:hypothetical protein
VAETRTASFERRDYSMVGSKLSKSGRNTLAIITEQVTTFKRALPKKSNVPKYSVICPNIHGSVYTARVTLSLRRSTMRSVICLTAALLGIAISVSSARAFDPILPADGFDEARLLKCGIVVRPWKPKLEEYWPAFEWVEVEFDCGRLPKDMPVAMTARFWANGKSIAATRTERSKSVDGKMSLVVSVTPETIDTSHLEIFMWSKEGDGMAASGYSLSLKRIVELSRRQMETARRKTK